MSDKYVNPLGLQAIKEYIDGCVSTLRTSLLDLLVAKTDVASESTLGLIKLNPDESVTLNPDNQLSVGGRLGQMTNTTGIYSPKSIKPNNVGNGSLLVTEASGTYLGTKSLSVTTGTGITLTGSHPAGSTTYSVTNSYVNRNLLTMCIGGVACLNENSSTSTVTITSIRVGSAEVAPSSTNSNTPIIISTSASANPDSATNIIRIYPRQDGFSTLYVGVAGGKNSGYSLVAGQNTFNSSNASAVFGNAQYNAGNSSLIAGRQHINKKQNAFLAGMGHDTTSGSTEVAAVGKWSNIVSTTLFAVGNGTSNTARKNAFEVTSDGGIILADTNGNRYKITVSTSGTLVTTAL